MKWKTSAKFEEPVESGRSFVSFGNFVSIYKINGLDGWYMDCRDLKLEEVNLATESFDEAIKIAKEIIDARLKEINKKCVMFLNDNSETEIVRYF